MSVDFAVVPVAGRVARRSSSSDSAYRPWTKHLDTAMTAHVARMAGDPHDVAVRICDVLDGRHTRLRQPMGRGSALRALMKRAIPFPIVQRLMVAGAVTIRYAPRRPVRAIWEGCDLSQIAPPRTSLRTFCGSSPVFICTKQSR